MQIKVIASGSSGNAYHIADGQSCLLLDAGIPLKKIQKGCGYTATQLSGCLITHAHGDHVKAAKDLARLGVDIYTSQGTIEKAGLTGHRIHRVKALEPVNIGTFKVLPFDVEHDAPEPLGFLIRSTVTQEKLLYFTDTYYLRYTFTGLTHVMMEANYDPDAMEENVRIGRVDVHRAKRTISSHMSIDTAIKTLEGFDLSRLQQVYLLHLSDDNSLADEFKRRVQALTGREVYLC
ncbi:MAG: MBL fold metallo-hydrolase [Lachnospiraceae bacterium]|nr:MBL fold metallo-hydrolase [Lachnospiraceae bacterium]